MIRRRSQVVVLFTCRRGLHFNWFAPRYTGDSNLRWRAGNSAPNNRFIVPIIDDDIPEPVEVLEIVVECEDKGNCYLPCTTSTYTIIIYHHYIDDQGT